MQYVYTRGTRTQRCACHAYAHAHAGGADHVDYTWCSLAIIVMQRSCGNLCLWPGSIRLLLGEAVARVQLWSGSGHRSGTSWWGLTRETQSGRGLLSGSPPSMPLYVGLHHTCRHYARNPMERRECHEGWVLTINYIIMTSSSYHGSSQGSCWRWTRGTRREGEEERGQEGDARYPGHLDWARYCYIGCVLYL